MIVNVFLQLVTRDLHVPRGPHVEMTAIAFASPGIGVAEALLFGSDMKSTNRLTSITVQPQNDLVSRIDSFQRYEISWFGCRLLKLLMVIVYSFLMGRLTNGKWCFVCICCVYCVHCVGVKDHNTGSTIPVACQGNPRHCHSVYATLCSMYRNCGSKRPHSRLQVPCGWCEDMPCATKTWFAWACSWSSGWMPFVMLDLGLKKIADIPCMDGKCSLVTCLAFNKILNLSSLHCPSSHQISILKVDIFMFACAQVHNKRFCPE